MGKEATQVVVWNIKIRKRTKFTNHLRDVSSKHVVRDRIRNDGWRWNWKCPLKLVVWKVQICRPRQGKAFGVWSKPVLKLEIHVFGHECCFEKVPKFPTDLDFKGTLGSHWSYKNLVVIYLKFLEGRIDTGINNQWKIVIR